MAHGKETTRPKMIGMMYLVLMAMLALNVSKDVLDFLSAKLAVNDFEIVGGYKCRVWCTARLAEPEQFLSKAD